MKFLAIDTSGRHLSVIAYHDGRVEKTFLPDCALQHSVRLMDEIDGVFARAQMSPKDCDFFAVVVGPGSFTGIRIGISTVKGLCFSCDKPALCLTSFDTVAYTEKDAPILALIDAGHGFCYACGYDEEKNVVVEPAYRSKEEVDELIAKGFAPCAVEALSECKIVDPCEGLLRAAIKKSENLTAASALTALYLRKSSAEENRK